MTNSKKLRVTITGASGYIGSALIQSFFKSNYKLNIITRKKNLNYFKNKNISNFNLNLSLEKSWEFILKNSDIIVHLHALTSILKTKENPSLSYKINVLPIVHLINVSIKKSLFPKIIFCSTATVYKQTNKLPISENHQIETTTIYDYHKYIAEQLLIQNSNISKFNSIILRFSNVYGYSNSESNSKDRGFLNTVIKKILNKEKVTVYGKGNFIRDYVYIDDIVNSILLSIKKDFFSTEIFNIGSGKGTKLIDAINLIENEIFKQTKIKSKIISIPMPSNIEIIHLRNYVSDIKKSKKLLSFYPNFNLIIGIKKTIKGYLKNI